MSCLTTAILTPSFCSFWHCHPYIPLHFLKMFSILYNYELTSLVYSYFSNADPLEVSFEQAMYEVNEAAGQVEVCVILTSPITDIFQNVVGVEVNEDTQIRTHERFPSNPAMASEFQ